MSMFLFPPKNYLYTKTKVKYLLPVLCIFIFSACRQPEGSQNFDSPPIAPIPPERFCFEQMPGNTSNVTNFELNLEGDSASGKIYYAKNTGTNSGEFSGFFGGTTLVVKCKLKSDTGIVVEEEKWNLRNDSLFRIVNIPTHDSGGATPNQVSYMLRKVLCK